MSEGAVETRSGRPLRCAPPPFSAEKSSSRSGSYTTPATISRSTTSAIETQNIG
jgi:hypothetical protein